MAVKRIVPNFALSSSDHAKAFYRDMFDLNVVMDQRWIVTFASKENAQPQLSIAAEGGSGTTLPAMSIEVGDVDHVYERT